MSKRLVLKKLRRSYILCDFIDVLRMNYVSIVERKNSHRIFPHDDRNTLKQSKLEYRALIVEYSRSPGSARQANRLRNENVRIVLVSYARPILAPFSHGFKGHEKYGRLRDPRAQYNRENGAPCSRDISFVFSLSLCHELRPRVRRFATVCLTRTPRLHFGNLEL